MRIEPQVSDPHPTAPKLAATAAPVPPDEPPGLRAGSYGFRVWPPSELMLVIPAANSCMLVLARMTAPASRSFHTWSASRGGTEAASASVEPVVGMSKVS